jgi:YebC/PmpR family DNA-binding regulatory protein
MGGGDPAMNPRLRSAVLAARAQNMPNENIERAIKRGTGEIEGQHFEELVYEGYAPGGVAVIVEAATDNKNRTASDLRGIFAKHHGNLASTGSVSYMFHKKGQITVPRAAADEYRLLEIALDAGAEELNAEEDHYVITTSHDRLYTVGEALKKAGQNAESMKQTYVPETTVPIHDETVAEQVMQLCDDLEENDDVQNVYSNFDLPEELLAKLTH